MILSARTVSSVCKSVNNDIYSKFLAHLTLAKLSLEIIKDPALLSLRSLSSIVPKHPEFTKMAKDSLLLIRLSLIVGLLPVSIQIPPPALENI